MKYKEFFWTDNNGRAPYWYKDNLVLCRFRYDPIPGSGKNRGYHYTGFRTKMRTAQELRMAIAHGNYVRGKRRKSYLYYSRWDDDVPRSDKRDRSWKNCTKRKHQWKR